jgi:hypothetical protein
MNISTAEVGADTTTELEVREYSTHTEIRLLTPRHQPRPVRLWVNGHEVAL